MRAVLKQIHELLPALTEQERAQLAHELIAGLDGPEDEGVEAAWETEIERRLDEVESGKVKMVSREEFSRHMREVLGR